MHKPSSLHDESEDVTQVQISCIHCTDATCMLCTCADKLHNS
jgi:hypothetical protein